MRKIAIIICICLLTISVGLLDVHNGNLNGFLLMLVGITCFVSAVAPPITFYLHVILPYKKIAEKRFFYEKLGFMFEVGKPENLDNKKYRNIPGQTDFNDFPEVLP